jgi:hypothetical protein
MKGNHTMPAGFSETDLLAIGPEEEDDDGSWVDDDEDGSDDDDEVDFDGEEDGDD